MSADSFARRVITYVGREDDMSQLLRSHCDERGYSLETYEDITGRIHELLPSWRWLRVVVIDEFESFSSVCLLEQLKHCDAGVPVIALTERTNADCMTTVALARLHGADQLVLKPLRGPAELTTPIDRAFRRLEQWRALLDTTYVDGTAPTAANSPNVASPTPLN